MILITLSLILIALSCGYSYLTWNFGYWKKRGARGPIPKIICGNFPNVIFKKNSLLDELAKIYNDFKNTERFVGVYVSRTPQVVILDPKLARDVVVTNFANFYDNQASKWPQKSIEKISAHNPFFSIGTTWKERRSEISAGLSISKLKSAYPIMQETSMKLMEYLLRMEASNTEAEAKDFAYKFTGETVANFLWGIDAGAFTQPSDGNCTIIQVTKDMINHSFKCSLSYYTQLPIILRLHKIPFYPKIADDFFTKLQNDAIELRLKNKLARPDFLNYMMQLQERKNISTIDMVGHSLTVVLDGVETSALILSHSLYFLAKNQILQNRLREEILAKLQGERFLSFEDLMDLPFLDQVVYETIRILTPIPIYSKICTKDTEFINTNGTAVKIDVGTVVHIPIHSIHHDPDHFSNPSEFIPERFDDGLIKKFKDSGAFMPFGDGPRICIGMKLGQLEVKCALVEILKTFQFSPGTESKKNTELSKNFILSVQGDFNLKLRKL